MTTKYLSADDILNAPDLVIEEVPCPEWGGVVFVRNLSGADRDAWENSIASVHLANDGQTRTVDLRPANLRARLCAMSICDKSGALLFTPAQVDQLGQKSAAPLDRIFDVARRLSGLTKTAVDDAEKN